MRNVQSFSEIDEETTRLAGGKGGILANLYKRGYPVPDGFIVLTSAFTENGLNPEAWELVKDKINDLKDSGYEAFAVRSSALYEDSETSFAGGFETVLGAQGEEEIREAINNVWRSGRSERVKSYNQIYGLDGEHEIAVVVQSLVDSEIAGVLFTVDPVSGSMEMLGNYVHGLGEKLVSGETDANKFTLSRQDGVYRGPRELSSISNQLYEIALKLESDLGSPQDIEWAVSVNNLYILQSRPITTLNIHDPKKGYYNHSLLGDYIWNRAGIGENLPGIMKPSTWSVWKIFFLEILEGNIEGIPSVGNLAGRPYVNMSVVYAVTNKIYGKKKGLSLLEPVFGNMPKVTVPPVEVSYLDVLGIMLVEFRKQRTVKRIMREVPEFIKTNPGECRTLIQEIKMAYSLSQLKAVWLDKVKPLFIRNGSMLKTINEQYNEPWRTLSSELKELVGKENADVLMTTIGNTSEELASLGVLAGISRIVSGELSRDEYFEAYGHRFPDEWHLHVPRPSEDSSWIDEHIEIYKENPFNMEEIVGNRRVKFEAVWKSFQAEYPKKSRKIRKKLDRFASLSLVRERIRSEIARSVTVIRELYLRAGELSSLGEDVFLLTYNELESVFDGNNESLKYIPFKHEIDARLKQLPEYPSIISGAFNPFTWSKSTDRRVDVYDSHKTIHNEEDSDIITGNPGSGGRFEGKVRVINTLEEGPLLRQGEILVTSTTNIGWTPLFPRAAAIITDIGMPLAHAAIVAREIGIPAVVGCGNATTRLKTGNRVLVDGDHGVIKILDLKD